MKTLQWLWVFEGLGNNQITDLIKRVQTDYRIIVQTNVTI